MKILGKQVLILGGFYFIISNLLFMCNGYFFEVLNLICSGIFIALLLVLCFKKEYIFLTNFNNRFIKSASYLLALGCAQYFSIIFITIPGIVYGYKTALAQYNGDKLPEVPVKYLEVISYAYWVILFCSLTFATYKNLKKINTKVKNI